MQETIAPFSDGATVILPAIISWSSRLLPVNAGFRSQLHHMKKITIVLAVAVILVGALGYTKMGARISNTL